jgi:hypothetical protein
VSVSHFVHVLQQTPCVKGPVTFQAVQGKADPSHLAKPQCTSPASADQQQQLEMGVQQRTRMEYLPSQIAIGWSSQSDHTGAATYVHASCHVLWLTRTWLKQFFLCCWIFLCYNSMVYKPVWHYTRLCRVGLPSPQCPLCMVRKPLAQQTPLHLV